MAYNALIPNWLLEASSFMLNPLLHFLVPAGEAQETGPSAARRGARVRFFASDHLLALSVAVEELPTPWILPAGHARAHRDRLARMLARALAANNPRVRLVQIRWLERGLIKRGAASIPEATPLAWWRVDGWILAPEVLAEAPRIVRGCHLFDFDGDDAPDALAWLAPLKVNLLHRLLDELTQRPPVRGVQGLDAALAEGSRLLVSPVDLLDYAEWLLTALAAGRRPADAARDALAHVIADRVVAGPGPIASLDAAVIALARASGGGALDEESHRHLRAIGLAAQPGGPPGPPRPPRGQPGGAD